MGIERGAGNLLPTPESSAADAAKDDTTGKGERPPKPAPIKPARPTPMSEQELLRMQKASISQAAQERANAIDRQAIGNKPIESPPPPPGTPAHAAWLEEEKRKKSRERLKQMRNPRLQSPPPPPAKKPQ